MGKILVIGDIDEKSFAEFSEKLQELEESGETEALVDLCSYGGEAYIALAFRARMRMSKLKITVTGFGIVASAAVMILASGHKRYMTKECWVMVHEDSGEIDGEVTSKEKAVIQERKQELQWNSILAGVTKAESYTWAKLNEFTTYLTPKECLRLGLIDGVV